MHSGGHRRVGSGSKFGELSPTNTRTTADRIGREIFELETRLEQKYRERKLIGKIYSNPTINTSGSSVDPLTSLKVRNIAFPWRRGTRIGEGGAGVAFRVINCTNGSIVCMKEIRLSSIASRSLLHDYPEKLRRIDNEIDMIMNIEHENIVRYFGIERYKVNAKKENSSGIRSSVVLLFVETDLHLYGVLLVHRQAIS